MKSEQFKPMLAPNEKIDINTIQYPIYSSYKLDGIRCLFVDGEMLSRSFKPIRNKVLQEKFANLKAYSKANKIILDGELYMKGATFQEITSYVMTENKEVPKEFKFWCFDMVYQSIHPLVPFSERITHIPDFNNLFKIEQRLVTNAHDVQNMFEDALNEGFEGLILKAPNGYYKYGRATLKEGLMYKVKPFETFDGEIVEVIQATEAREGSKKTLDVFGYSKTSHKKDDRTLIQKASAFRVKYLDTTVKATLAMTDPEKQWVWDHRDDYIGKVIEYKGMQVGAKDVPRHPVFLRYREDKEVGK
jgi:DNA ligase 1